MSTQKNRKIICFTCAYNAEKTLVRAMDSVLNQTYSDITYYVCDNGSSDRTREIIFDYARRDKRIIPMTNEINHIVSNGKVPNPSWVFFANKLIEEYDNGNADYVFNLDSDDEYLPDFLQEMISFLEENELDIACCGSDFIDAGTGVCNTKRLLAENLILEGEAYSKQLVQYHNYMRTVWAKLFRCSLIKKCDYGKLKALFEITGGQDAVFCTHAYINSNRVGILAKVLHRYYENSNNITHSYYNKRIYSMMVVFDTDIRYLNEKKGADTQVNREFIYSVHIGNIARTIFVILKLDITDEEKLIRLHEIFSYPQTQEMISYKYTENLSVGRNVGEDVRNFLKSVSNWILSGAEVRSGKFMDIAADIHAAMNVVHSENNFDGWTKDEKHEFLKKIRQKTESDVFKHELGKMIGETDEIKVKKMSPDNLKTAICFTCAYNAEKTIARTIDSVLKQTYAQLIYYVCDNGSTDKTREIIIDYADRDSRVIPVMYDVNQFEVDGDVLCPIYSFAGEKLVEEYEAGNAEYFFNIDADDEYLPEFLEEMVYFIENNNLDIACSGSNFINAETGEIGNQRTISSNLILEGDTFTSGLTAYYDFMRTVWGKLFRISLIKKCDILNYKPLYETTGCNDDCLFSTKTFLHANRAGILSKVLHKYYEYKGSTSYTYRPKRVKSLMILYDEQMRYIETKSKNVSVENKDFLNYIHLREIFYSTLVLFETKMTDKEKLNILRRIFSYPQAHKIVTYKYSDTTDTDKNYQNERNTILKAISVKILSAENVRTGEMSEIATDIFAAMSYIYSASFFGDWTNSEMFEFLFKTYRKSENATFKKELEDKIVDVATGHPMLIGCNAEFIVFFSEISLKVLKEEFNDALELIAGIIENEQEIPEDTGMPLIELGLQIAATVEKVEYFVFMKKVQISLFIDKGLQDKAREELAEWLEMMPHDEDFTDLSNKLKNDKKGL